MLKLNYSKSGIKRYECWFCDDKKYKSTFTRFFQASKPSKLSLFASSKETFLIKLNNWSFSSINKKTRYDIRRIQDQKFSKRICTWQELSLSEKLDIMKSYDKFSKNKKLTPINSQRLDAAKDNVFYSIIEIDSSFSFHLYIHDKKRIRLLYSWSLFNKPSTIVKAGLNKLHTAADIEFAKENDFEVYDFGGYKESRMNGIDRFKTRFGGDSSIEYNYFKIF